MEISGMGILKFWLVLFRAAFYGRVALALENLALRQQLAVYQRTIQRPKLRNRDRIFWAWLSRLWGDWRSALILVQPATVVNWHRQGFKLYWRWKSRHGKPGRPRIERELRDLIRRMNRENPTWGAPRIQAELKLLGYQVAESTVAKYLPPPTGKPRSQNWKTFLKNHRSEVVAVDFLTVPTATFRLLYVFTVLSLDRRRVLHFNVTPHPSAVWTARQVTEAFPYDTTPRYLIRDNDGIYGQAFRQRLKALGIQEVRIAPRSPWQNGYVERLIGSIRRECLDHVIVLNEAHLTKILKAYFAYYHESRPHLSLDQNAPQPREVEPPDKGPVVSIPQVGGLNHRYIRAA